MAVHVPNLGAINTVGSQFTHNIFAGKAKKFQAQTNRAVRAQRNAPTNPGQPQQFPRSMSSAPAGTGPLGPNAAAAGRARRQARAQGQPEPTPRTTQASGKAPFSTPSRSQASGAHPFAPAQPTHAPTVHLSPQFSSAEVHTSPPANIMRSSATHATPKFSSANEVPNTVTAQVKPSTNPFQVNTIHNSPAPSAPSTPARSSLQFSDTSAKDNSPFPTHVHPAGSSSAILPHLTASQSTPGRPNEFTVGSRNVKGSGIGAMGSMLEQSAMEMRNRARGQ